VFEKGGGGTVKTVRMPSARRSRRPVVTDCDIVPCPADGG